MLGEDIDPRGESVVTGDACRSRRLLVVQERRTMLARAADSLAVVDATEYSLLTARQNVVACRAHSDELPHIVVGATEKMRVESKSGIWPHVETRVDSGVRNSSFHKRREPRKAMVDVTSPVKGCMSGAKTLFAVGNRSGAGQNCRKVEHRIGVSRMNSEVRIAQTGNGIRPRGGRGPNEIDRCSHGKPVMRVEVITDVGIQLVDRALRVGCSTKLQICSHTALLCGRSR